MVLTFSAVARLRPLFLIVGSLLLGYTVLTRLFLATFTTTTTTTTTTTISTTHTSTHHATILENPPTPNPNPSPKSDPYAARSNLPPSKPPELLAAERGPSLSCPEAIAAYGFIRGLSVFQPDGLSKHLIVPHIRTDDITWLQKLPSWLDIVPKIYIADPEPNTPAQELQVPRNKGNEAMTYLTYIIEHYFELPDVAVFVHAHTTAWHNNDLHLDTTPLMLRELNFGRARKKGYMNLRCHWVPGCPDWIQPFATEVNSYKYEEQLMAKAFRQLFPGVDQVPEVVGTACCAQFAVTRERIQMNSINDYLRWRQWLLDTTIENRYSGRILEYLWHYIFSPPEERQAELCPLENVCYCDGYGMCFGGRSEYDEYVTEKFEVAQKEESLKLAVKIGIQEGDDPVAREVGMNEMRAEVKRRKERLRVWVMDARERGRSPEERLKEVGEAEFSG